MHITHIIFIHRCSLKPCLRSCILNTILGIYICCSLRKLLYYHKQPCSVCAILKIKWRQRIPKPICKLNFPDILTCCYYCSFFALIIYINTWSQYVLEILRKLHKFLCPPLYSMQNYNTHLMFLHFKIFRFTLWNIWWIFITSLYLSSLLLWNII